MLESDFRILECTEEKAALYVHRTNANLTEVCKKLGCDYAKAYRKLVSLRETGGFRKNGRPPVVPAIVDNVIRRYVGKQQRKGASVTIDELRVKLQKEHSHALLLRDTPASADTPTMLRSKYVYDYAKRVGINREKPLKAEPLRIERATQGNVRGFFENTLTADFVEGVPGFLFFNADETHCEIGTPRVVCTVGETSRAQRIDEFEEALHITAMVTINAMGDNIKPLLILPNKNMPQDTLPFVVSGAIDISGSGNGWMNEEIFAEWAEAFISNVQSIRAKYQCNPNERAILILDGHDSRNQIEIMQKFKANFIDVVILPAHLTHILQPFDVAIGRPFKQRLTSCAAMLRSLIDGSDVTKRACIRIEQIIAIIDGLRAAITITNCMHAFAACGFVPYDPGVVLSNKDISKSSRVFEDFSGMKTAGFKINGKCITDDDVIPNLKKVKAKDVVKRKKSPKK